MSINGNHYYGFIFKLTSRFPIKDPIHFQILHSLSLIFRENCPKCQAPDCEMAVKSIAAIPVKT